MSITIPVHGQSTFSGGFYAGTRQVLRVSAPTGLGGFTVLSAVIDVVGTAQPSAITLSRSSFPYWGGAVQITGSGFTPSSFIGVTLDDVSIQNAVFQASATGTFSITAQVPRDIFQRYGPRVINAVDETNHRASAVITLERPAITLDRTTVTVGEALTLTGVNLDGYDDGQSSHDFASVVWLDDLNFTGLDSTPQTITIPRMVRPGAEHTFTAISAANGFGLASAEVFVVAPHVSVTPSSGAAGTAVTLQGSQFMHGQTVQVWIDQRALGTAIVGSDGTLAAPTAIPLALGRGTHTFLVTSADGVEKAIASFTIP
jgi:hypothetical protein